MIDFSEDVKNRTFVRSGLKCECNNLSCGHIKKCAKPLYRGNWHATFYKHPAEGGDTSLNNCMVICTDCHANLEVKNEKFNMRSRSIKSIY